MINSIGNCTEVCYYAGVFILCCMPFVTTAHAAEEGIAVNLSPYVLGYVGTVPITATLLTAWLSMLLLLLVAWLLRRRLAMVPSHLQSIIEVGVGGLYDYVTEVLGSKKYADRYFPIIFTIFIFILTFNWIGLIPGVGAFGSYDESGYLIPWLYPSATDINMTIGLAIVSFVTIQLAGIIGIGLWRYVGKFINLSSPLAFVVGLIELISELARLISFSFRLFGNIFAGKVLLLVVFFFVPYLAPIPVYGYEVFVGLIQAVVFAILTLFFIKVAITEPH